MHVTLLTGSARPVARRERHGPVDSCTIVPKRECLPSLRGKRLITVSVSVRSTPRAVRQPQATGEVCTPMRSSEPRPLSAARRATERSLPCSGAPSRRGACLCVQPKIPHRPRNDSISRHHQRHLSSSETRPEKRPRAPRLRAGGYCLQFGAFSGRARGGRWPCVSGSVFIHQPVPELGMVAAALHLPAVSKYSAYFLCIFRDLV